MARRFGRYDPLLTCIAATLLAVLCRAERIGVPGEFEFGCPVGMVREPASTVPGAVPPSPVTDVVLREKGTGQTQRPPVTTRAEIMIETVRLPTGSKVALFSDPVHPAFLTGFGSSLGERIRGAMSAPGNQTTILAEEKAFIRKVGNGAGIQYGILRQTPGHLPVSASLIVVQNYDTLYYMSLLRPDVGILWEERFEAFLDSLVFAPHGPQPAKVAQRISKLSDRYYFNCPPELEVQCDAMRDGLKTPPPASTVILQQKGLNDVEPTAMAQYARVIIRVVHGKSGEFAAYDAPIPEAVLAVYEDTFRKTLSGRGLDPDTRVDVQQVSKAVERKVGNARAAECSITRALGANPPVVVRNFFVQNDDISYRISLSHRKGQDQWSQILDDCLASFVFLPNPLPTAYLAGTSAAPPLSRAQRLDLVMEKLLLLMLTASLVLFILLIVKGNRWGKAVIPLALLLAWGVWALVFASKGDASAGVLCVALIPMAATFCIAYPVSWLVLWPFHRRWPLCGNRHLE